MSRRDGPSEALSVVGRRTDNARGAPALRECAAPRALINADKALPLAGVLTLLLLLPSTAHAEYTRIELKIFGMDCAICAHGVRVAIQKIDGVESVTLSLERAEADIRLRQDNRVSLDQFRQIVKANGFEPRQATVTAVGTVREVGGRLAFEVSGVPTPLLVVDRIEARVRLSSSSRARSIRRRLPCSRSSATVEKKSDGVERIAVASVNRRNRRPAAIDAGTSGSRIDRTA